MPKIEWVEWDREKLERFRRAYNRAARLLTGDDVFTFEGSDYVVDYAKHLINYLDGVLEKRRRTESTP